MSAIIRDALPCASGKNQTEHTSHQNTDGEAVKQPCAHGAGLLFGEAVSAFSGVAAGLVLSLTSDTDTQHGEGAGERLGTVLDVNKMRKARLRRSVLNAANYINDQLNGQGGRTWKVAMLTLTYAEHNEYERLHITGLLKCIRAYMERKGYKFHYVWVLENTKKGKPHYHILIWLPKGVTLPKPDKRGWWVHGSTRIEWIRKNGAAYIAKYCAKHEENQGDFPKGARLHGCGGLSTERRWRRSWWNLPRYVRNHYPESELKVRAAAGGGWVSKETGEWLDSPYKVMFAPLRVVFKTEWQERVQAIEGGCTF
jgi:hypothetical protein